MASGGASFQSAARLPVQRQDTGTGMSTRTAAKPTH
jgi:hypothetical protein